MRGVLTFVKLTIHFLPYIAKAFLYGLIAMQTYYLVALENLNAPEMMLEIVNGPILKATITVAAIEALHNLVIFARKLHRKMVPKS